MLSGPIPEWIVTAFAAVTVFTVMLSLGLGIVFGELRWIWQRPDPIARGLFSVLVAVPALALLITRALDVPRLPAIGIVLMAISPGAPMALRRSLDAGGHHAFAPSLQLWVAVLAVASIPLSLAALNPLYAGHASVTPGHVARQVFFAQLLPLGLGMALRHVAAPLAGWLEPRLARIGTLLLIVLAIVALIDVWDVAIGAGLRVASAIVLTTIASLAIGHLLGGPEPATRTAVAITSAARNPGLALLVAALNSASDRIQGTVLAYLVISMFTIIPYMAWRRHIGAQIPRNL
jgi:BASS family bile acid:Na+ symporter